MSVVKLEHATIACVINISNSISNNINLYQRTEFNE